ncbi:MAG: polyphosphate kinase 2 family protein [Breznakibacter sp.]
MGNKHRFDHSMFMVNPGTSVNLSSIDPAWTHGIESKEKAQEALLDDVKTLTAAQEVLWAAGQQAVLIIFQAMDAAGKDSTIKHVMSGVNPQGCVVHSFKAPSEEEKQHHFLWRPARYLPGKGQIAIFNRSYYEEVLVVKVHPSFLKGQWLPPQSDGQDLDWLWQRRYDEIRRWEQALAEQGITIIKFFLHVSKKEQKERFLKRLDTPEKNFKFSAADVSERAYWDDYQTSYQQMLSATSTAHAPWYVVPADKKWFTRAVVADVITARIEALDLKIPQLTLQQLNELREAKQKLERE